MPSVIAHYQEIALKGRNRPWFVARLVRNLKEATADLDVKAVRALDATVVIVSLATTGGEVTDQRVVGSVLTDTDPAFVYQASTPLAASQLPTSSTELSIARAIANIEKAAVPIAGEYWILNAWRY